MGAAKTDSVEPVQEYIEARGGEVHLERAIKRINTDANGEVTGLQMMGKDGVDGEVLTADMYVSAMPCDIIKLMLPEPWAKMPFFRQTDELEGIPVINIHLWFDTKLNCEDHLMFSRSPLLSVYADMSTCCKVRSRSVATLISRCTRSFHTKGGCFVALGPCPKPCLSGGVEPISSLQVLNAGLPRWWMRDADDIFVEL